MFLEYFDTIRKKPKIVRKRYALLFTFGCTGVIVLIWLGTILISNYGNRSSSATLAAEEGQTEEESVTTLFNSSNSFIEGGEIDFKSQTNWEQELQALEDESGPTPVEQGTSTPASKEGVGTSTATST